MRYGLPYKGSMKQTCSNCTHSRPTYKGRYCVEGNKRKMVRLADTCGEWKEKRK